MAKHTIQEYLGVPPNWPVVEKIKHEIVLLPSASDIKRGKRNNPRACALHNAACRMFDIPNCAIGGRWAYIPQRDHRGKYYIARMQATEATQRAIQKFDRTGVIPVGGFHFRPIAPSHRYEVKNAYQAERRQSLKSGAHKKRKMTKRRKAPTRAIPRSFAEGAKDEVSID